MLCGWQRSEEFFNDILAWVAHHNPSTARSLTTRVQQKGIVANPLSEAIMELVGIVDKIVETIKDPSDRLNLTSAGDRLSVIATELERWRLQELEDGVYWIESSLNRFHKQLVSLNAVPIDIGPILRETLFSSV